jgi:hypothetical protein
MDIAYLVDDEVMRHLAMYGCIKNADPMVQYLVKTSEDPLMRFRRTWMRRMALKQHLEAEARQRKINDQFKQMPVRKGASVRRAAVFDPHLAQESRHYNNASFSDKSFVGAMRREAPAIFPKRET